MGKFEPCDGPGSGLNQCVPCSVAVRGKIKKAAYYKPLLRLLAEQFAGETDELTYNNATPKTRKLLVDLVKEVYPNDEFVSERFKLQEERARREVQEALEALEHRGYSPPKGWTRTEVKAAGTGDDIGLE